MEVLLGESMKSFIYFAILLLSNITMSLAAAESSEIQQSLKVNSKLETSLMKTYPGQITSESPELKPKQVEFVYVVSPVISNAGGVSSQLEERYKELVESQSQSELKIEELNRTIAHLAGKNDGWSNYISISLTVVTVVLGVLALIIAGFSFYGYKKVIAMASTLVEERVQKEMPTAMESALQTSLVDSRDKYDENGELINVSQFQRGLENIITQKVRDEIERIMYRGVEVVND